MPTQRSTALPIIVRLAEASDGPLVRQVARLEREVELDSDAAERLATDERTWIALALVGDAVVGYGVAYLLDRIDGRRMLLIYDLFVADAWRRQGMGRRLMELLLATGRAEGICKAWLFTGQDNAEARRLYEACGGEGDDGQRLYWFPGS